MSSIFDTLGALDKGRIGRYQDQSKLYLYIYIYIFIRMLILFLLLESQVLFEQATFALIKDQKYNEDESVSFLYSYIYIASTTKLFLGNNTSEC
jgi:hypothetical protein